MNLLHAEARRLVARRFVQLMVVLLIGTCLIAVVSTVASSHTPTDAELREATEQAATNYGYARQDYEMCRTQRPGATCVAPDPADFRPEDQLYGTFVFAREISGLVYFVAAFLSLFGFLVGASFVGAEMSSGGLTNLLLWRPRRPLVLGAKLAVAVGAVLALSVVVTVAYIAAFWGVSTVSGFSGDTSGTFWPDLVLITVRALLLVLGATVVGFSLAALGRHTAAALGVVAAYVVLWEIGLRIVLTTVETPKADQWMLSSYLAAFVNGRVTLWNSACATPDCTAEYVLTWVDGTLVGGAVTVLTAVAAFVLTQRRDMA
ncbi:ABC transporter permease subunit [Catenuloplanes indicus]|uniref:Membrane protein n=1 Tax=Catenuloplanes indicus TaxID=137267 RepID=A0AAE4AZA7_9ACTN|nr:ABC transporter permease subunit [Catenuloplanes indicus]MDQ0368910.1 putative membrane protein [Catenuloplanes indicus]